MAVAVVPCQTCSSGSMPVRMNGWYHKSKSRLLLEGHIFRPVVGFASKTAENYLPIAREAEVFQAKMSYWPNY